MKKIIPILYICASLPILLLSTCSNFEHTRSSYNDYASLKSTIDRGWLPENFPQSATNIEEGHNIDTNAVWASFNYDKSDIQKIKIICKVIIENEKGIKLICPPFESTNSIFILRSDGTGSYESGSHGI